MPLNPNSDAVFIGLSNYLEILSDSEFYRSLGLTVAYILSCSRQYSFRISRSYFA